LIDLALLKKDCKYREKPPNNPSPLKRKVIELAGSQNKTARIARFDRQSYSQLTNNQRFKNHEGNRILPR